MSEQKPAPPQKPIEQTDDVSLGTQPWAAWIVAALGVILVVIVVYLALERAGQMARRQAASPMTPIVGGMLVATPAPVADVTAGATVPAPQVTATLGATLMAAAPPTETVAAGAAEEAAGGDVAPTGDAGEENAQATPDATATPVPPTATPRPTATTTGRVPARPAAVFAPGDEVVTPDSQLTLYADAGLSAPLLDTIQPHSVLTVLEPSGDYTAYPVLREGHSWVRVRAGDGLAGWIIADMLALAP